MSFRNTSSTRWRGRAIAVAGIAAAATVGGIALATSASAAVTSATLTAPVQVANDGTPAPSPVSLTIVNTTPDVTPALVQLNVTIPAGLTCGSVTLAPSASNPGPVLSDTNPTGTAGSCTFVGSVASLAANSSVTYDWDLSVNVVAGTSTGTVGITALVENGVLPNTVLATSNTTSTNLVAVTPPAFVSTAVPPATIYHNYSFQFGNVPFPAVATSGLRAFGVHKNPTTGVYSTITHNGYPCHTNGTDVCVNLSSDFRYDATTGLIENYNPLDSTNSVRYWTWTIIENNGKGGASCAVNPCSAGVSGGSTTLPTPVVNQHDVVSPSFTTPVLFSDVSLSSSFATEIYALSDDGDISGYADGTFRPGHAVSRLGFAAILGRTLDNQTSLSVGDGPCSLFHPSAFPDVPNASPFCEEVRDLASLGIIGGYSDGKFHPGANITRQAVSALLFRANAAVLGASVDDAQCTTPTGFTDVSASNPFCGDIEWMKAQGYANGYADGGFHPTANVSRQATAAFIDRIFFAS